MKINFAILLGFSILLVSFSDTREFEFEKPNIVVIMADDMGYSDIGCYGGEIETPNLDALAENGVRFSQFYNAARCCPTQCEKVTGNWLSQGIRASGNYMIFLRTGLN